MKRFFYFAVVFTLFLCACKSAPLPPPAPVPTKAPSLSLAFERVEAHTPEHLGVFFALEIENPFPSAGRAKIQSWQAEINGQRVNPGSGLELGSVDGPGREFSVQAESSASFPLRLSMDMAALAAENHVPADDYTVKLLLELDYNSDEPAPHFRLEVSGLAAFPGVQAPVFTITAIAILKAELINTRFRVTLRIANPNPFPIELSAFNFELFGNGRLWADGAEKNIITVPAKSSIQGNLFLLMNFINMKRDILDQIVNLIDVNYRFRGKAQVSTGVEYLPRFSSGFDLSGYSKVLEN